MFTKKQEQEGRQLQEEFRELYSQLSAWQRFQFHLCIKWIVLQRRWGRFIWDWLILQWKINEKMKAH